jgi:hypothetical protein
MWNCAVPLGGVASVAGQCLGLASPPGSCVEASPWVSANCVSDRPNVSERSEPPDDKIEPEITESAPYALFSTDDDFVTASMKLIERKRLVPPEESDEADEDAC